MSEANGEGKASDSMPRVTVNPERASVLASNLSSIQSRIASAVQSRASSLSKPRTATPRLVAVSKLKPASDILALHSSPTSQLHFGENYVQELLEKSRLLPGAIRWHFIGGLQSNKCAQLARDVPNLWAVESVDSTKKAQLLDKGRGESKNKEHSRSGEAEEEPLRVFVQVNTSGEESKSGLDPKSTELVDLCKYIRDKCQHLTLQGLMTIGAIARSQATTAETENEDFESLWTARSYVTKELGMQEGDLELSMGMSEDFEGAIIQGSDEVRIGSTIFGERPPKKEAKVLDDTETASK